MPTTGHVCPNCQNPVKPDWRLCPNCGQSKPATPGPIRCRVCGRSAAGILHACPHCGANLEAKPVPYLQLSVGVLILAGLIFGLIQVRPTLSNRAGQVALLIDPPTVTATATNTATPTSTATSTSTATPTPTNTPTGTLIPTETPTSTPTPTETPTFAITWTPTAPATFTPTPTPRFSKPVLLAPKSGELYGRAQELVLRWEDMGPLGPNESYAVRMTWQQNGQVAFGGTNVKENFWIVPPDLYWGKADEFTGRKYEWYVFVEAITVENGQQVGKPISEVSDRWSFLWQ